eukprot:7545093-Pyramimonas_sp.AAC.1
MAPVRLCPCVQCTKITWSFWSCTSAMYLDTVKTNSFTACKTNGACAATSTVGCWSLVYTNP